MPKYITLFLILIPLGCLSQDKKFPLGMTLDYQFLTNRSFSIGFGYMAYMPKTGTKEGFRINFEYMPTQHPGMKNIYGLRIEAFLAYKKYLNLGYGLGYFKDNDGYKVVFTPEFGLGYKSIFLVYRRNMNLFGKNLDNLNKNNVSVRLYIPFNKNWFKLKV